MFTKKDTDEIMQNARFKVQNEKLGMKIIRQLHYLKTFKKKESE